jgi:hypothetical protein
VPHSPIVAELRTWVGRNRMAIELHLKPMGPFGSQCQGIHISAGSEAHYGKVGTYSRIITIIGCLSVYCTSAPITEFHGPWLDALLSQSPSVSRSHSLCAMACQPRSYVADFHSHANRVSHLLPSRASNAPESISDIPPTECENNPHHEQDRP